MFDFKNIIRDTLKEAEYEFRNLGVQPYLFSVIAKLAKFHSTLDFQHINVVDGADPGSITSELVAHDQFVSREILSLRPHEMAMLVPMIKIYARDVNGDEKELIFQDFYNENTVKETLPDNPPWLDVPNNVGIKGASLSVLDERPGDINILFNLHLHFQNITKFDGPHLDLVSTPEQRTDINPAEFRIKAEVGWKVPNPNSLLSEDKLKAISKMRRVLLLDLIQHNLSFNQDGTIDLEIEYQASIEAGFKSDLADIFNLTQINDPRLAHVKSMIEINQDKIKEKKEKIQKISEKNNSDESLESLRDEISSMEESINKMEETLRTFKYKKLLAEIQKKGKIYYITVPQSHLVFFGMSTANDKIQERKNKIREDFFFFKGPFICGNDEFHKNLNKKTADAIEAKEATMKKLGGVGVGQLDDKSFWKKEKIQDESVFIYYITLGDLIEAAAGSYFEDHPTEHILLGTFNYTDPQTTREYVVSLADVPISLQQFNIWFVNNVVKTGLTKYPLGQFITDIVSKLITPALTNKSYPPGIMPPIFTIKKQIISSNNTPIKNGRIPLPHLFKDEEKSTNIKYDNRLHQYMVLYVDSVEPERLEGNEEYDRKKGIYHLFLGTDYGIVKNAEFSKVDLPHRKDALITGDSLNAAGKVLRESYDVTLTLYGNTLFNKETYFYINGSYLGREGKQFSHMLGLGGYYIVTDIEESYGPEGYETVIKGTFQSSGEALPRKAAPPIGSYTSAQAARDIEGFTNIYDVGSNVKIVKKPKPVTKTPFARRNSVMDKL